MMKTEMISFSYGKRKILKEISLKFEKGKLYAIIGPNGCGKTTLIKMLSRLSQPQRGHLLLDNIKYGEIGRKTFAQNVALLPQGRNVPNMTVYDLAACGRFPHLDFTRRLTSEDEKMIQSALRAANVEEFAEKSVKKLSGGERQRVYIAMLLAQNSPYVLLDEPTTHLDISAKFEVMNLLCRIRNEGKCVIAVLHDLEFALKYADEVILMEDGKVISQAVPEELIKSGRLQEILGVKCGRIESDGQQIYFFSD